MTDGNDSPTRGPCRAREGLHRDATARHSRGTFATVVCTVHITSCHWNAGLLEILVSVRLCLAPVPRKSLTIGPPEEATAGSSFLDDPVLNALNAQFEKKKYEPDNSVGERIKENSVEGSAFSRFEALPLPSVLSTQRPCRERGCRSARITAARHDRPWI